MVATLTPTTVAAVRTAVRDLVNGITPTYQSSVPFSYVKDVQPSGVRVYTILLDPGTHEWILGEEARSGGDATSWGIEMRIRVAYEQLAHDDAEDMAASDHGDLWRVLHPNTTAGVVSFMRDGSPPTTDVVVPVEDGGPVVDFVFPVHYMRQTYGS